MTCPLCCEQGCAAEHFALVRVVHRDPDDGFRIELELLDVPQEQKEKVVLQ